MTAGFDDALEERLARFVEHHVLHGERLPLESLCADRPELVGPLRTRVAEALRGLELRTESREERVSARG